MSETDVKKITRELHAAMAVKESVRQLLEGDPELLQNTLEGETDLFEVVDALVAELDETTLLIGGIEQRSKSLSERKTRLDKRCDTIRSLIEQAMEIAELPKMVRPSCTLVLANRPPKLMVTDEAAIPSEFWKADPVLDKAALKTALKEGRIIEGAGLSNAAPSLTVKRS